MRAFLRDGFPVGRRTRCPFCGLIVIFDDDEATVHHEASECDRFSKLVERAGLTTTFITVAEHK